MFDCSNHSDGRDGDDKERKEEAKSEKENIVISVR